MIIAGEDAVVAHPSIVVMSWLVCAMSKGYVPSKPHFRCALQMAHDLAACPYREVNYRREISSVALKLCSKCERFHLDQDLRTLARSVLLRRRFGGMHGDMKMLSFLSRDWTTRFAFKKCPRSIETSRRQCFRGRLVDLFRSNTSKITSIPSIRANLRCEDVLLESVDFHCCPSMTFEVLRAAGGFDAAVVALKRRHKLSQEEILDQIRSAIWYFRSSINSKKIARVVRSPTGSSLEFLVEEDEEEEDTDEKRSLKGLWELIRGHAEAYSRRIVRGKMRSRGRGGV